MEKDVALGSVGKLAIIFSGGKATVSIGAGGAVADGAVSVQADASASVDSLALLDLLFAAIEKATPAAAPLEEGVKAVIKAAVSSIA